MLDPVSTLKEQRVVLEIRDNEFRKVNLRFNLIGQPIRRLEPKVTLNPFSQSSQNGPSQNVTIQPWTEDRKDFIPGTRLRNTDLNNSIPRMKL